MTPVLERFLLPRMNQDMFKEGSKLVASHFNLKFPRVLLLQSFPSKMESILRSFKVGDVGSRDLAVAVAELAEDKPHLWELASMMSEDYRDGAAVLRQFREGGETTVSNAPMCWTTPLGPTHQVQLQFKEILNGESTDDAKRAIEAADGHINLVFRLTNRPAHGHRVAALMWQLPNSHNKFWLNCLEVTAGKKSLVQLLLNKCKYVDNSTAFQSAMLYTFKTDKSTLASIPGIKDRSANVWRTLATVQRRASCQATKKRIIKNTGDMDEAFLFHFSWELDILADYMSDFERA